MSHCVSSDWKRNLCRLPIRKTGPAHSDEKRFTPAAKTANTYSCSGGPEDEEATAAVERNERCVCSQKYTLILNACPTQAYIIHNIIRT